MKKNFKLDKTSYIKYHFSETDNKEPYLSVEISIEKIRNIFDMLKENFGETETIKDYSIYKIDYALCTHAYVVSKRGIIKFLNFIDNQSKWDYPIDHIINKFDNINKYLTVPQLVKQSVEKSYIRSKFLMFEKLL